MKAIMLSKLGEPDVLQIQDGEAHRMIESRQNIGKILLKIDGST